MFKSGMMAATLISVVREDVDISVSVSDDMCIVWLNALHQMLYSDIIREQRMTVLDGKGDAVLYTELAHSDNESIPEGRDITAVFADGIEAQRVTGGIGVILHGDRAAWYDGGSAICMLLPQEAHCVQIAHIVRPSDITADNQTIAEVCVPPEFIPMVMARIRGEMYKLVNEDGLAAKWLSDYNTELETFKVWAAAHTKCYGM